MPAKSKFPTSWRFIVLSLLFIPATSDATKLTRRSFLIGSGAAVTPLILPSSDVIKLLSQEPRAARFYSYLSGPPFPAPNARFLIGPAGTGKSEYVEILRASGFTYRTINLEDPDFPKKWEEMLQLKLRANPVTGVISEDQLLSVENGEVVFAEDQVIKRGLGWQTLRLVNATGNLVNGLVRVIGSGNFENLMGRFSRGQIAHEREALTAIEQLEGPSEGCGSILSPPDIPRIIVEEKEGI